MQQKFCFNWVTLLCRTAEFVACSLNPAFSFALHSNMVHFLLYCRIYELHLSTPSVGARAEPRRNMIHFLCSPWQYCRIYELHLSTPSSRACAESRRELARRGEDPPPHIFSSHLLSSPFFSGSHSRLFLLPPPYGSSLAFLSREDFSSSLVDSRRIVLCLPTV